VVGDCAVDGGVFSGSYAVVGAVEKVIPVDLHIRGCPPRPIELLRGLLALLEAVVGARHASPLSRLTPLRPEGDACVAPTFPLCRAVARQLTREIR
jgi:NADH:ubiquinone oxidoreductase subunit B-like Fe-S oxidoreductase